MSDYGRIVSPGGASVREPPGDQGDRYDLIRCAHGFLLQSRVYASDERGYAASVWAFSTWEELADWLEQRGFTRPVASDS